MRPITHISVTACINTLARSIYDMRNVWSVPVYIVASQVRSKKNKPKGTGRKLYSAKKVGPATRDQRRRPKPLSQQVATRLQDTYKAICQRPTQIKNYAFERSVRKLLEGKTSITSLKAPSIRK